MRGREVCFLGEGPQNLADCHKDFANLGCPSLWMGVGQMPFDWPHPKELTWGCGVLTVLPHLFLQA